MKSGNFSFHVLTYSLWGLVGLAALSGIFLSVYYVPAFAQAFGSVRSLEGQAPFGWMIRGLHAAGGSLLLLLFLLHLLRVFYAGDYKSRPGWVWAAEVFCVVSAVGANFSGFFLPLSQEAYWGTAAVLSALSALPGIGKPLAEFLRGGRELGGAALARFFAMHIGSAAVLVFLLFSHGRRASGNPGWEKDLRSLNGWIAAGAAGALFAAVTFAPSWFADSLREAANPAVNPQAAPAPWYLGLLQEALLPFNTAYPVISVLFGAGILALVFFLPWFDRSRERAFLLRPVALCLGSALLAGAVYFTFLGMAGADYGRKAVIPAGRLSPAELRGARVFAGKNCAYCHQVFGREGRREGPDMAVVSRRNRPPEWLQRFILNARLNQPGTTMPRYEIPLEDLEGLSAYLLGLDHKNRKLRIVSKEFLMNSETLATKNYGPTLNK